MRVVVTFGGEPHQLLELDGERHRPAAPANIPPLFQFHTETGTDRRGPAASRRTSGIPEIQWERGTHLWTRWCESSTYEYDIDNLN